MRTAVLQNAFLNAIALLLLLSGQCLSSLLQQNAPATDQSEVLSTLTDEFSFSCLPLTAQLSDPIMSPGAESSHAHVVAGGTAFQRMMGEDTAKRASETTCEVALDRSNYWIPALYRQGGNGFEMVEYESSAVYYLNRACDYDPGAQACEGGIYPLAPPAGLRMVAGNPMLQTYDDSDFAQRAISHMCLERNGGSKETKHLPQQPCEKLRSQVFFPSCWDGKNLDSPDHKSHVAYPVVGDYNKGVCPKSHPRAIFSLFVEFIYNTKPYPDYQNWVYATGDRTGYGLHGDFINGWTDQVALQTAFETCMGSGWLRDPRCSITKTQKRPLAPLSVQPDTPMPGENLGQEGSIRALPGHPELIH
ncbi:DUF1996 domain-containing protein [Aspergillus stella-maris]|uniref:DUF1996 domain-containing protein n=1 Tax=Aspergillus stella-maris TaxID=1810926 RepID=UPI003CCCEAE1